MFDTLVSAMQKSDVTVTGEKITGTLKYLDTGSPAEYWGAGYFLALKWSNLDAHTTSLKVGIIPSEGSGMVECFSDLDRNGYFKVTNKDAQKIVLLQSGAGYGSRRQEFDISGLTLEAPQ